jgi:hypothetical protein
MLLYINGMFTMGILKSSLLFLTVPHNQCRGVGKGMNQTYLYLWYYLFQAQWGRRDQQKYQT